MPEEDSTSNGASFAAGGARLRRPVLERSEPRRGWANLYAPGRADAAAAPAAANGGPVAPSAEPAAPSASQPSAGDAATRVVRDGYRIVEENLRRGRQVASELRGARREVADFASRLEPQKLVTNLTQTLIDPALTRQLVEVAQSWLGLLGALAPTAPLEVEERAPAPVALHPQERANYGAAVKVLKLRATGPSEWLADMEIDGQLRRVQVRAVDGDL
jgi:hypothetical protein